MATTKTISVSIEAAPLTDTGSARGGSFMIHERVERSVWERMRSAGAVYFSAEELEDMDMFFSAPGWRYSLEALKALVKAGYTLAIRGETVTDPAQLEAMFSATGQAAYNARIAAEQADRERREAEELARRESEREAKGAAYEAWMTEHLAGLVQTYANDGADRSGVEWQRVASFDADTPGAWRTTGDQWYSAVIDGETCYKRYYGNACLSYAPQRIVDQWCEAHWSWRVGLYGGNTALAARQLLEDSLHEYIGSDIARRLIEVHGADHYVRLATATEWWVFGKDSLDWEGEAARHYGAYPVYLQRLDSVTIPYGAEGFCLPNGKPVKSYWRHPDGRIIAQGYREGDYAVMDPSGLPDAVQAKL